MAYVHTILLALSSYLPRMCAPLNESRANEKGRQVCLDCLIDGINGVKITRNPLYFSLWFLHFSGTSCFICVFWFFDLYNLVFI